MLLSILKALLGAYDNTIKEINKEPIEEKSEDQNKNRTKTKQYALLIFPLSLIISCL